MKVTIVCLGKVKEAFNRACIEDYVKRLSRYCKLTITELADLPCGQNPSQAEIDDVLATEAKSVLAAIPKDAYVFVLAGEGKQLTSEGFSEKLQGLALADYPHVAFVIGSSHGLDPSVKKRANMLLSFSSMTFPHQIARILILEQLYRAFRIWKGEPYHK